MVATAAPDHLPCWAAFWRRCLARHLYQSSRPRMILRTRMDSGVTSTHSSSLAKSRDSSRLILIGGVRVSSTSAVEERMLVMCLASVMFTSSSSGLLFTPTTWPSYTGDCGSTKKLPRACRRCMAYGVAIPLRSETMEPF